VPPPPPLLLPRPVALPYSRAFKRRGAGKGSSTTPAPEVRPRPDRGAGLLSRPATVGKALGRTVGRMGGCIESGRGLRLATCARLRMRASSITSRNSSRVIFGRSRSPATGQPRTQPRTKIRAPYARRGGTGGGGGGHFEGAVLRLVDVRVNEAAHKGLRPVLPHRAHLCRGVHEALSSTESCFARVVLPGGASWGGVGEWGVGRGREKRKRYVQWRWHREGLSSLRSRARRSPPFRTNRTQPSGGERSPARGVRRGRGSPRGAWASPRTPP